jgi:hypothetical protein
MHAFSSVFLRFDQNITAWLLGTLCTLLNRKEHPEFSLFSIKYFWETQRTLGKQETERPETALMADHHRLRSKTQTYPSLL